MSESSPENSIEDRIEGNRYWLLVLIRANRWVLVVAILGIVFCLLLAWSRLGLAPFRQIAATQNGVRWLFSAFIGAIITGTSVVITINQLVLSQELGAVGDQRDRMQAAMTFQRDVESALGTGITPPEPSAFLAELVSGIRRRAVQLEETADDRDSALSETISEFVDDVTTNADGVTEMLDSAQFGTFGVIWGALAFNYSWKINVARQIRYQHGEALSADAEEALDELLELLKFFGEAREHFKTLYFQWELINLSRALLYIAVPALVVMGGLIMYLDATTMLGSTLGVDHLVWATSAGFTVGIAPFIVFIVFILRIVTVAKHTLAMGPFILRETN